MSIFLIFLFILLISHLTVDKELPEGMKIGAWVVFAVIAILYIIFALIL